MRSVLLAAGAALASLAALLACATGAPASPLPTECLPPRGTTQTQCRKLNALWHTGKCGWFPPNGVQPVSWVGTACLRPCAVRAAKLKQNPFKACRQAGFPSPNYEDGGCHVYSDCRFACQALCAKQPYCYFQAGTCLFNVTKAVPPGTRGLLRALEAAP